MNDIVADLQGLADALTEAEVRATLDPSKVNPPGVYITLDKLTDGTLTDDFATTRARLLLLVPDRDNRRALEALQALYTATLAVVTPTSDVEATTGVMPDNTELPALTFTTDI